MPGHLTARDCVQFSHLRLNEREARLPLNRHAPVLQNNLTNGIRTLRIVDDCCVWLLSQNLLAEQRKDLLTDNEPSAWRDSARPVAVGIRRETDMGVPPLNLRAQIRQEAGNRGVRKVVWEISIRFAVKTEDFRTQIPKYWRCDYSSCAVSSVVNDI